MKEPQAEPRRSQSSVDFNRDGGGGGGYKDSAQKVKSWHSSDDVYSNGKREDQLLASIVKRIDNGVAKNSKYGRGNFQL